MMTRRMIPGLAVAALWFGGCGLQEPPARYPQQCYQTAACGGRAPVVVQVNTPPAAPSRAQCPAGTAWHRGRPRWDGSRWVRGRGRCVRSRQAHRPRRRCVFLRGRWVRTWQGWRVLRGRWVCRR